MVDIHRICSKNIETSKGPRIVINVVDRVVGYHNWVSGCSGKTASIDGVAREVCRSSDSAWAVDSIGVEFKTGVSPVVIYRIECAHGRTSSAVDVVKFDLKIVLAVGIDSIEIEICYGGVRQLVVARPGSHCGTCTVKANPVVATNNLAGVNSEVRCRVVVASRW